ncbi:MAG: MaoC family dehydratase [Rhodoferax sp.]
MRTLDTLHALAEACGTDIAETEWIPVSQEQVNLFAQATGDHQWIHVDVERSRQGPFGGTIAHGFLTLSLLPRFFESALHLPSVRMGINYGLNRVRFITPVPVGSRLRARLHLQACEWMGAAALQTTWLVTVEREGADKPVCTAEAVQRLYE